mgnify:FL=1
MCAQSQAMASPKEYRNAIESGSRARSGCDCGSIRRPDTPMPEAMKPEDLERLVTQTMPYGKYKGRLIADLPGNYLNWFARVGFPPGSLGQLLELMHEIDHNGLSALLEPLRRRNASRG